MLSEKIKLLFIQKGFVPLTEEERQQYTNVLIDLNIPLDSIFAEFNLATCGPIQKLCWIWGLTSNRIWHTSVCIQRK